MRSSFRAGDLSSKKKKKKKEGKEEKKTRRLKGITSPPPQGKNSEENLDYDGKGKKKKDSASN